MRRVVIVLIVILAVLAGFAFALPYLIPASAYKSTIEAQASKATGRTMTIAGDVRFTLYPVLGLSARDVRLDNAASAPGGTEFVHMDGLAAGVKLWPLLSGKVEITKVVLEKPVIRLIVDSNGNSNWTTRSASTAATPDQTASTQNARFEGVEISDGEVSYEDLQDKTSRRLEHINIDIAITALNEPVGLTGDVETRGQKLSVIGKLASLETLRTGAPTPVDISLTSPVIQASFKGTLARHASQGEVKLVTQSLANLIAWANKPLKAVDGLGRMSLEGTLKIEDLVARFTSLRLVLNGSTLTGTLALDRSGDLPLITANLKADQINLNHFLGSAGEDDSDAQAGGGWSRKPMAFGVLEDANADLTLETGSLRMRKLKLGHTAMTAHLKDGVLNASLNPISLFGGNGRLTVIVSNPASPRFASMLHIDGVGARAFLTDAMGISRIDGAVTLNYDITAAGKSSDAIMHSVGGHGDISFANGRIYGVDLAHIAGEITKLLGKGSLTGGDNDSTVFTAMGGSFTIANGVMNNKDFHMESPFIRLTGAGNIDLGARTLDYVVKPKAVATLSGQGGNRNASGLSVPFRIHGPWTALHYTPDLSGVAAGLLGGLTGGGGSASDLLGGLLGGKKGGDQPGNKQPDGKKKSTKPLDALKGLFGGH